MCNSSLLFAFTDPILWRGLERLIIDGGAIFFAYLGYKLYLNGVSRGRTDVEMKAGLISFVIAGGGPGLLFMAFGAFVLGVGLTTGGAKITSEESIKGAEERISKLTEELKSGVEANAVRRLEAEVLRKDEEIGSLRRFDLELRGAASTIQSEVNDSRDALERLTRDYQELVEKQAELRKQLDNASSELKKSAPTESATPSANPFGTKTTN